MRCSLLIRRCAPFISFISLVWLGILPATAPGQSGSDPPSAEHLWSEYEQSPTTRAGAAAGRKALRRWGTAANTDRLINIAHTLPPDAEIWPTLVEQLRTSHRTSTHPLSYREGYKSLLQTVRERVTDPKGWMHVMIALGDYYADVEGDQQRAITTYEDAWRNGDGDHPGELRRLKSAVRKRLRSQRRLDVGTPAPSFQVTTLSGSTVDLDQLEGNPVILYFWARWCIPCRRTFPKLNDLADTDDASDLHILGLIFDVTDRKKLDAYLDDVRLDWPQAVTDDWPTDSRSPQQRYGVTGPGGAGAGYAVLIDREGRIAADGYEVGPLRDSLQSRIDK